MTDSQLIVVRAGDAGGLPQRRALGAAPSPDDRLLATLGRAAPADLPPVSAIGVETALEAMADASKLAIAADLDCWLDWCASERRAPCPADPEDVVRYLRALEADGKKPATLSRRVASLATVHRLLGLDREANCQSARKTDPVSACNVDPSRCERVTPAWG